MKAHVDPLLLAAVALVLLLTAGCFGPAGLSDEQVFPEAFIAARGEQDELLATGREEEARKEAATRLDQERSAAHLTLAARVEAEPDRALILLDEAVKRDADFPWARYGLAFTILKLEVRDRYEESAEHLYWLHARDFLRERNDQLRTRRLLIENLSRLGRAREAIPLVEEILDRRPGDGEARTLLAWLLCVKSGDPEDALEELERILTDDPDALEAKKLKGKALVEAERFREAAAHYETFVDEHPDALLNLGLLHEFHLEDRTRALGYYRRYREYTGERADERRFYDLKFFVPTRIESLEKELAAGAGEGGGA